MCFPLPSPTLWRGGSVHVSWASFSSQLQQKSCQMCQRARAQHRSRFQVRQGTGCASLCCSKTWCSLSAGSCLNKLPERMELSIPHTALWSGINKQRLAGTPGMAGLDGIVHYLPCSWEDSLKIGLTIRTNEKKIEALRASSSHQLLPHLLNATPPGMSQAKISQRNRLQKHLITSTNERQL